MHLCYNQHQHENQRMSDKLKLLYKVHQTALADKNTFLTAVFRKLYI